MEKAGADGIHIDVMDGHFVPDLTLGPPLVKRLRSVTNLPFDVHLMVSRPENFIAPFARAGADRLTFHIEAVSHPLKTLQKIKALKMKAGLTLRPATPVESLRPFLKEADLILIMTVEPGKEGQTFLKEQAKKIQWVRENVRGFARPPLIAVDGGVTPQTAHLTGLADVLISGSYIFRSKDYARAISLLKTPALS